MSRDIKQEFKEIVRVAAPFEKLWMSGYLEANIDEDLHPSGFDNGLKSSENSEAESLNQNREKEKYLSMAKSISLESKHENEFYQNGNLSQKPNFTIATIEAPSNKLNGSNHQANVMSISKTIQIVFGTETGNSKKVANSIGQKLKSLGLKSKILGTTQFRAKDLSNEEIFVCIVSTHGDGEPPEAARKFYNELKESKEKLTHLKYAVLGLGDSSYPLFCQTGKDIDKFLKNLGAKQILPTGYCDVDYEEVSQEWTNSLLKAIQSELFINNTIDENYPNTEFGSFQISESIHSKSKILTNSKDSTIGKQSTPSGKNTIIGRIRSNNSITDSRSTKEIRHIEIESEVEIPYQPGDSIGIFPKNDNKTIATILRLLGLEANEEIVWRDQKYPVKLLFQKKVSIRYLSERVLDCYERLTKRKMTRERLDLIDVLSEYPPHDSIDRQSIIDILEPIPPRYYSIASSPLTHGTREVHITVADVNIDAPRRKYQGLCTGNLFSLEEGSNIEFRILNNENFRIPESDTDIIMIGPGTGIAPFRSFLYERDGLGHTGKNWLFFGNRNFSYDFLYQSDLLELFDNETLTKINTAFSRDSDRKVYVQDKLWEKREEIMEWIENGATIYICGSKVPMSQDVDDMLIEIFHNRWKTGRISAKEYLNQLIDSGRYKKDVY